MTEFNKGSVPCISGQILYTIDHPKVNLLLSYPIVSIAMNSSVSTPEFFTLNITNRTTTSFDVILSNAPTTNDYSINWQINVPGTDIKEYVNDKRYYSKEELGTAKLSKVHWRNIISAPDLSSNGLQKSHTHDNRYYTKEEIPALMNTLLDNSGSYSPIINTLMLRDNKGRCQVNTPKVGADVANKSYTDITVNGEANKRILGDLNLQTQITSISGDYVTRLEYADIVTKLEALTSLIVNVSGTGLYAGGDLPVGSVITYAGSGELGIDYHELDGTLLPVSGYNELFNRIMYTWGGSGDLFKIPDVRGEFIRGWDNGRGIDINRIFGSFQDSANKDHTHTASSNSAGGHNHTATLGSTGAHYHNISASLPDITGVNIDSYGTLNGTPGTSVTDIANDHTHDIVIDPSGNHDHSITIDNDGESESRPRNIAFKFFIRISKPPTLTPVDISSTQEISGQKSFILPIIVPKLAQGIIFGDPSETGTLALGIIANKMVITQYTSGGTWIPINWLT